MNIGKTMEVFLFGVSMLMLTVSGNFVGETLSCELQQALSQSMIMKHVLILFIIFFSIGLSDDITYITNRLVIAFCIWVLYLCINRMPLYGSYVIILLLFVGTIVHTLQQEYDNTDNLYNILYIILFVLIFSVTVIGVVIYIRQKYQKTWSFSRFVFGTPSCKNNGDGTLKERRKQFM